MRKIRNRILRQGILFNPQNPYALLSAHNHGRKTHKVSRRNFLGLFPGKTEINASSVEKLANGSFPPTFVWACEDDGTVDYNNSVMLCDALRKNGVPHEFKLFKTGGHGIGLANGKEPEGWFDSCFEFYKKHI